MFQPATECSRTAGDSKAKGSAPFFCNVMEIQALQNVQYMSVFLAVIKE